MVSTIRARSQSEYISDISERSSQLLFKTKKEKYEDKKTCKITNLLLYDTRDVYSLFGSAEYQTIATKRVTADENRV